MLVPARNASLNKITIFTDAAWRKESKSAGLSWILKKQDPESSSPFSAVCEFVSSPLLAECLAIRAAFSEALRAKFSSVVLHSDCQVLVKTIKSKSTVSEAHGVLSDIYLYIGQFTSFVCCFIPRRENLEADSLAKAALTSFVTLSV